MAWRTLARLHGVDREALFRSHFKENAVLALKAKIVHADPSAPPRTGRQRNSERVHGHLREMQCAHSTFAAAQEIGFEVHSEQSYCSSLCYDINVADEPNFAFAVAFTSAKSDHDEMRTAAKSLSGTRPVAPFDVSRLVMEPLALVAQDMTELHWRKFGSLALGR